MHAIVLNSMASLIYTIAATLQGFNLTRRWQLSRWWVLLLGTIAVLMHGQLLHHWIDVAGGQNLSALNMLSLLTWLVSLLVIVVALFKPVENLAVFIFPLATASILSAAMVPSERIVATVNAPPQLAHILLSVFTFSVLVVAGLQALLVAMQEQHLRAKRTIGLLERLPSLEVMEKLLFQLIVAGFVLLTVLLGSSYYFFHAAIWQQLLHKTIIAFLAWTVFAVLLLGRQFLGWRGRKTVYTTLAGVLLLLITYAGSQLFTGSL